MFLVLVACLQSTGVAIFDGTLVVHSKLVFVSFSAAEFTVVSVTIGIKNNFFENNNCIKLFNSFLVTLVWHKSN